MDGWEGFLSRLHHGLGSWYLPLSLIFPHHLDLFFLRDSANRARLHNSDA
jgi:hypothetical protein